MQYIQDKLDAIENDLKEKGYTKFERETIIDIAKQSLTDYHNHIVEKMNEYFDKNASKDSWGIDYAYKPDILSLLQDTNLTNS